MTDSDLGQFADDLNQEVLAKAGSPRPPGGDGDDAVQLLREELFTETVMELLHDHDEVEDWQVCFYEGRGARAIPGAKVNAWALSGDGATLDLFISLYFGTGKVEIVGRKELRRQFELLFGFLKRAMSGFHVKMEEASTPFNLAREIHEAREMISTVRLFLLTDGLAKSLDIDEEKLPNIEIKYVVWDLGKLSQLRVGTREVIELDLVRDYGGGLPCLEQKDQSGEFRTYLTFIPAELLARIYGEYGQRLLERNVRAFLQTKNKVNKGLQATLKNEPQRFLAYNNGLCCTAAEVRIKTEKEGPGLLAWVKDLQIVNGGQTTASIYQAKKKENIDLDGITVQAKLTVISNQSQVAEIVPMISRFANSQSKVSTADLSANGKFHRELEALSRLVWSPAASGLERGSHWYYERARGSYLDDKIRQGTPTRQRQWSAQNPLKQKITKTDLAKYEHAWLGLPHLVCRGAEKNFTEFAKRLEEDGEPEVNRAFFESVVARAILWRDAERDFDLLGLAGYRANSVAYAVSWLAEKSDRRLDLAQVWRAQRLPQSVSTALAVICRKAHDFLNNRPGNIGEASKKPETWNDFRNEDIRPGKEWMTTLSKEPAISYQARRPDPTAGAAKDALCGVAAERWFALSKWAKERGLLKGWERSLAYSLGIRAAKGTAPSDKQAVQGERILARAVELGFDRGG